MKAVLEQTILSSGDTSLVPACFGELDLLPKI